VFSAAFAAEKKHAFSYYRLIEQIVKIIIIIIFHLLIHNNT
jgi:hypothetical protein